MTDDPIHTHPTVQALLRSHKRLTIAAVVLIAVAICLIAAAGYDHTIGYSRPAALAE
jgi:hypothetical protein